MTCLANFGDLACEFVELSTGARPAILHASADLGRFAEPCMAAEAASRATYLVGAVGRRSGWFTNFTPKRSPERQTTRHSRLTAP